MEGGKLFAEHPEWFGAKDSGTRSKAKRQVFCTSNSEAVDFVTRGVLDYLKARPEIEVFELWPPDGAEWCACDACDALGDPQDRQALLVNHVQDVLAKERPNVRLEIIAYSKALLPPAKVKLDERILVDFCPINQSFEVPINDPSSDRNREYAGGDPRVAQAVRRRHRLVLVLPQVRVEIAARADPALHAGRPAFLPHAAAAGHDDLRRARRLGARTS